MASNAPRTRDEEELHLWEASRRYMSGDIGIRELEEIERPHMQSLKGALLKLAKRRHSKMEFTRRSSSDERERYLWMASRLYMSGDIGVEKLEEIELPHTREFKRAMISLAKRKVLWRLFELLGVGRGRRHILDL